MEVSPDFLKACSQYDEEAVRTFYVQFGPSLFGLCLRYAASSEDAEDLFHELFLYLLKKVNTYRFEGDFKAWLKKVSIRFIVKKLKAKRDYPFNLMQSLPDSKNGTQVGDESFSFSNSELLERVIEILHEMPEGYRTIFCLHVIDGYKHREIAEMLGIAEGTSKSQLARAIQFIKKKLKSKAGEIEAYEGYRKANSRSLF